MAVTSAAAPVNTALPAITMTAATLLPTSSLFTADVDATLSWDEGKKQFRARSGKVTFR